MDRSGLIATCIIICSGFSVAACEESSRAVQTGASFEVLLPTLEVQSVRITDDGKVLVATGPTAADDLYCADLSRDPESRSLIVSDHGCKSAVARRDDPLQRARRHWSACGWMKSSYPTAAADWKSGLILVESRATAPPHIPWVQLVATNSCDKPDIMDEASSSLACAMPEQGNAIVAAYSDALAPAWFELVEIRPARSDKRRLGLELSGEGGAACSSSGRIVAVGYPVERNQLAEAQVLCRMSGPGSNEANAPKCTDFMVKDSYEVLDIALSPDGNVLAAVLNTPTASGVRLKLAVTELQRIESHQTAAQSTSDH